MNNPVQNSANLHLLEINLVSAQQLKPKRRSKTMKTYVVAWIDRKRKLKSRIDSLGRENPTWNDKFIFVLDDQTLSNINSTLVIEIYVVRIFRTDKNIGTVRILLDNLFNSSNRYYEGLRGTFRSFQIRRPTSDAPQGILNIGVMILDGGCQEMMNEIMGVQSAIGYRELTGGPKKLSKNKRGLPSVRTAVKLAICGKPR